jgi:hypothetical protein
MTLHNMLALLTWNQWKTSIFSSTPCDSCHLLANVLRLYLCWIDTMKYKNNHRFLSSRSCCLKSLHKMRVSENGSTRRGELFNQKSKGKSRILIQDTCNNSSMLFRHVRLTHLKANKKIENFSILDCCFNIFFL